jgi:hypothetical protein
VGSKRSSWRIRRKEALRTTMARARLRKLRHRQRAKPNQALHHPTTQPPYHRERETTDRLLYPTTMRKPQLFIRRRLLKHLRMTHPRNPSLRSKARKSQQMQTQKQMLPQPPSTTQQLTLLSSSILVPSLIPLPAPQRRTMMLCRSSRSNSPGSLTLPTLYPVPYCYRCASPSFLFPPLYTSTPTGDVLEHTCLIY